MQALVFHGWWIVGVAMLAQAVSVGLAIYSYGLLVLPIGSELGASRMEMMWGKTGLSLMTIVVSPILGVLLDRHSTRALMILGVLALGSAFALISVSRSPWEFAFAFAVPLDAFDRVRIRCATVGTRRIARRGWRSILR